MLATQQRGSCLESVLIVRFIYSRFLLCVDGCKNGSTARLTQRVVRERTSAAVSIDTMGSRALVTTARVCGERRSGEDKASRQLNLTVKLKR